MIPTALHSPKRDLYQQRPVHKAQGDGQRPGMKRMDLPWVAWIAMITFIYFLSKCILKEVPEPFCQVLMDDRAPNG